MLHGWCAWLWIGFGFLQVSLSTAAPTSPKAPRAVKAAKALTTDSQFIRVHVKRGKQVNISGYGLNIDSRIRFNQYKKFKLRCDSEKKNGEIVIKSLGRFRSPLEFRSKSGFLFVSGKPYRKLLRVIAKKKKCIVVNISPLERYIAGVVAKEMHPAWPMEALKAQAVAARSYAIANMKKPRYSDYDLVSTTMDQVYTGATGEDSRTLLAARATRGLVLRERREVLRAYYHSHCGGRTDIPKNVWGRSESGYISVSCPFHKRHQPQSVWRHELPKSFLQRKLKSLASVLPQSFRELANLRVSKNFNSNRVVTVTMADDRGNSLELEANHFRKIIGNGLLKSTKFHIIDRKDSIEFKGSGFGHGVGLCQYGSKEMAERGKNFKSILKHYYPLASLRKLY